MKVEVEPGRYIVAVSGGVDSAALLDILSRQPGLELIVAHFDHGIRLNSALDRKFVKNMAGKYQLKFEFEEGLIWAEPAAKLKPVKLVMIFSIESGISIKPMPLLRLTTKMI